ncbi:type III-B CRISPR module RAMP protein Cmr4 [Roseateles sp. GG27B]
MFNATRLVFYYAISPVHMGAGSAIGAIDSPIQREVHTLHPMFAGSGLKGALRHHLNQAWPRVPAPNNSKSPSGTVPSPTIARLFGPDTGASDYAGALSLSDAQVVALPVRSLKNSFAYVSSPLALARLLRLAQQAGIALDWKIPAVAADQAVTSPGSTLLSSKQLVLEALSSAPGRTPNWPRWRLAGSACAGRRGPSVLCRQVANRPGAAE